MFVYVSFVAYSALFDSVCCSSWWPQLLNVRSSLFSYALGYLSQLSHHTQHIPFTAITIVFTYRMPHIRRAGHIGKVQPELSKLRVLRASEVLSIKTSILKKEAWFCSSATGRKKDKVHSMFKCPGITLGSYNACNYNAGKAPNLVLFQDKATGLKQGSHSLLLNSLILAAAILH